MTEFVSNQHEGRCFVSGHPLHLGNKIRNESVQIEDFDGWRHMSLLLEIFFGTFWQMGLWRTKETFSFFHFVFCHSITDAFLHHQSS